MVMYKHIANKTIMLGVTGGIAAYKAAALASKLRQAGAELHVIMTRSAAQFVQPLTFQTLSQNRVMTDTFEERNPSAIAHIDLADRADLFVIAPATANVLGKLANGIADDMLTTTLLATQAPVMIAPAMNVHMYDHPAVQENIAKLAGWGYLFIEPAEGQLACGYVGKGRMEEPETILQVIDRFFAGTVAAETYALKKDLSGKRVLITAGATRERLDPVRFFSNRSTGKMGYAIAEEARDRGAEVVLIAGATTLPDPVGMKVTKVESAQEMYDAVLSHFASADVVVKAAAVADYRPAIVHPHKMKKQDGALSIQLERTPDILKLLGQQKTRQILVGFAAESENLEANAMQKIKQKNLDMIVANNILSAGAGFAGETNIVTIFDQNGKLLDLPQMAKKEVAQHLWDEIVKKWPGEKGKDHEGSGDC